MLFNQNQNLLPFRILIAPLDWGLGHATRCIPVIRYLLEKGCDVTIAASGAVSVLLRDNFPNVPQLPLHGYDVSYSHSGGTLITKIITQIPKILKAIRSERQWLRTASHRFDLVISDNRYGLKIDGLPSVIMTHQLQIRTGFGAMPDALLRRLHYRMLEKFDACWVVDQEANGGLAGALSHPPNLPVNAQYIGLLSQLQQPERAPSADPRRILVLLSGPEPMRGLLEAKLIAQMSQMPHYHFQVIAGKPAGNMPTQLPAHIAYTTHANAAQVSQALADASLVICRSGYSTLMDLAMFGKKALLIPTPGQSEQEYLARHLHGQRLFFSRKQSELDLAKDIDRALQYPGFRDLDVNQDLKAVIDLALQKL